MSEQFYATKDQLIDIMKSQAVPVLGAGGGFAPIGTEAYFDGTTAPQGWLICDGSTKNINDYPELAAYIASQHGSSNYYGGNGTTTFGLPTRNGMPYNDIQTPNEHIVGEWRETVSSVLKKKPLYEKCITGTTPSGTGWLTAYTGGSADRIKEVGGITVNIDGLLHALGYSSACNYGIKNNLLQMYIENASFYSKTFTATIKYIKTTDSWKTIQEGHSADGNGVFCIRAGVSGDANTHVYSTTEQIVGEWIDGKTIYEKTVNCGAMPNNTTKTVSHGISNFDTAISISGYTKHSSNGKCRPILFPGTTTTNEASIRVFVDSSNITIGCVGDNSSYTTSYITLRYTKTSA